MANINYNANWTGNTGTTSLSAIMSTNWSVVDRTVKIDLQGKNSGTEGIENSITIVQSGQTGDPKFNYIIGGKTGVTTAYIDWAANTEQILTDANVYSVKDTNSDSAFSSLSANLYPVMSGQTSKVIGTASFAAVTNTTSTGSGGFLKYISEVDSTGGTSATTLNIIRYKKPTFNPSIPSASIPATGGTVEITNVTSNYANDSNYQVTYTTDITTGQGYATAGTVSSNKIIITVTGNTGSTSRTVSGTITMKPSYKGTVATTDYYDSISGLSKAFSFTQNAGGIEISGPAGIANTGTTGAGITVTSSVVYKIKSITTSTQDTSWFTLKDSNNNTIAPY